MKKITLLSGYSAFIPYLSHSRPFIQALFSMLKRFLSNIHTLKTAQEGNLELLRDQTTNLPMGR